MSEHETITTGETIRKTSGDGFANKVGDGYIEAVGIDYATCTTTLKLACGHTEEVGSASSVFDYPEDGGYCHICKKVVDFVWQTRVEVEAPELSTANCIQCGWVLGYTLPGVDAPSMMCSECVEAFSGVAVEVLKGDMTIASIKV